MNDDGLELFDDDVLTDDDHEREPDPSDSLRTFGAVVQALRISAGLSREELGVAVRLSKHTIESIELGRRMPDRHFIELAEPCLGDTGALRSAAPFLSRGDVGLAVWFRKWARLEKKAATLYTYECRLVPGLLQSEPYARVVFGNNTPPMSDEQLEVQVARRLERQQLLHERYDIPFQFIVEEHLYRRRLGGAEVTRSLIDTALELGSRRNVMIQIVPLEAEFHACLDGPVQLLETPARKRLAYSEGQRNGRLISDPKEVSLLYQRYDKLRSQALSPQESRGLLERLRGEL